jgi:L-threonylcarbamoyladenylate synthase
LTKILSPDQAGISAAAVLLAQGEIVAFPTETVYGLGADARSDSAVARIFEAKGRPHVNPLIVHVSDIAAASRIALVDDRVIRIAAAFWPGPLTIVLPLRPSARLSPLISAGQSSVAIRVPAHPLAQALIQAFGGPVAAPSANPSGGISPTRAEHVLAGLSGRIAAVIDGGPCAVGVESTILSMVGDPVLLRPGGTPAEALAACLGMALPLQSAAPGTALPAPGMMASHYAPAAPVRLNAVHPAAGETWIGFGPGTGDADLNLSPAADLTEAAANLFHLLRLADARAAGGTIAVAPVPDRGLGSAINDRLTRASAPR